MTDGSAQFELSEWCVGPVGLTAYQVLERMVPDDLLDVVVALALLQAELDHLPEEVSEARSFLLGPLRGSLSGHFGVPEADRVIAAVAEALAALLGSDFGAGLGLGSGVRAKAGDEKGEREEDPFSERPTKPVAKPLAVFERRTMPAPPPDEDDD